MADDDPGRLSTKFQPTGRKMSNTSGDQGILKDLVHPAHADALKGHSALTVKLVKTVSDFTQQLAAIEEQHGEQLQQLVETFRKRNAELRRERPAGHYGLFQVWETLLQEVEVDSHLVADIANCLGRQGCRLPLVDGTFYRKLEARKIFQHREALEAALDKAAQQLDQSYQLYDEAYQRHHAAPNTLTLASYVELHNNYVQDVHAANSMADAYNNLLLPQLVQELESVYVDLSKTMTTTIQQGCEAMFHRAEGMSKRYSSLAGQCRSVNPCADLTTFVRSVPSATATSQVNKFPFIRPRNPVAGSDAVCQLQDTPLVLNDELVFDRLAGFSLRTKCEALKKEVAELETHVRQLGDGLESLVRMQQRSLEANLYNKASELQEDICNKKLEWRLAQLHLASIRAQRDLYGSKAESIVGETSTAASRGSRMSLLSNNGAGSSGTGIKTKWMKAIRSLTSTTSPFTSSSSASISANSAGSMASTAGQTAASNGPPSTDSTSVSARELEKGSRLYQAVMAVIAVRGSSSGNAGSSKGDKQQRHSGRPLANSSSDLLAYQQQQAAAFLFHDVQKHVFQENTYKKITPCDVCSQVLRGHSRQGWKCRLCKINVHADCKSGVGRCLPKSRLLRRQKSSSELEGRNGMAVNFSSVGGVSTVVDCVPPSLDVVDDPVDAGDDDGPPVDPTYSVLKLAGEMGAGRRLTPLPPLDIQQPEQRSSRNNSLTSGQQQQQWQQPPAPARKLPRPNPNSLSVGDTLSLYPSSSAPHSPRRNQKLNLRMKSFSLDESGEHFGGPSGSGAVRGGGGHAHQHHPGHYHGGGHNQPGGGGIVRHHRSGSNPSCSTMGTAIGSVAGGSGSQLHSQGSSYSQSPSSPVHQGRRLLLLSAKNIRMNSVELPDENEKSQSSASASPCPSPKAQRLLPTNLYVVLYNFKGREADELDLKAGYKVTVIDSSDADWWRGKCLGKTGFFPSKYVAKLAPNEKPLQVMHNLQMNDTEGGINKLLRDQIVIQVGEEENGIVTVRNGDNQQGTCPAQFLQEV